jgi:hypothetical protein
MPIAKNSQDRELAAISAILQALDGLDGESLQRVFDYVFNRLSISSPNYRKVIPQITSQSSAADEPSRAGRKHSIRDLKEEKQPESSNQMAALVAYYLSEVADEFEQKSSINTADLEKYFKQASFKLPKSVSQTLSNASAAGYFDPVGNGLYKLNAVGYNLVAHGMPRAHAAPTSGRKRRNSKKRAKPTKR